MICRHPAIIDGEAPMFGMGREHAPVTEAPHTLLDAHGLPASTHKCQSMGVQAPWAFFWLQHLPGKGRKWLWWREGN